MNRTIKEATVKRYHYDSHRQLEKHLADFIDAYNYGRRLKTLKGLTPYEYILCLRHDPKILWRDDAKVIGDRIAEPGPVPGDFFTQEPKHRIGELGAGRVGFVVGDMLVHHAP